MQKRRPIDKNIRNQVWQKYNKNSLEGECYVCERTITYDTFVVGHNKALAKGGTDKITNLRPLCHGCNSSMGTITIEQYKRRYFGSTSKPPKTKTAKKPIKTKKTTKSKKKTKKPSGNKVGDSMVERELREMRKMGETIRERMKKGFL